MQTYRYRGRDAGGQPLDASIVAASRYDALTALRTRGLTVFDVTADEEESAAPAAPAFWSLQPRVSSVQLTLFTRQLAIAIAAGMPLREALESIAEDIEQVTLRRVIRDVVRQLREGHAFSSAAESHPEIFTRLYVALLQVAEESGSLARTLEYLATSMERSERLSRKIRSVMAYPVFIGVFFVLVCGVMTFAVVPRFQAIFGSGDHLPRLTRVVFGTNRFVLEHATVLLAAAAALVSLVVLYVRTPAGRLQRDTLATRLVVIGTIVQKYCVTRFCRQLAILLQGGVPVASALSIAAAICGNLAMERGLLRARERIVSGAGIAAGLAGEPVFPRLVVRMVGIGEASGKLPEVLERVADTYEDQVEGTITVAVALLEPLLICLFGMIVLVLVLAIYLPVFTSSSHLQ